MHFSISRVARTHDHHAHHLQGKLGLNYDDPVAVNEEIPHSWWLADESCKYILSVLVHKDNKDLSTRLTKQPPGPTRAAVRGKKRKRRRMRDRLQRHRGRSGLYSLTERLRGRSMVMLTISRRMQRWTVCVQLLTRTGLMR